MNKVNDQLKEKLLVVCTGNTCRSPMAAAELNRILAEQNLEEKYTAVSAGVAAFDGQPAALNAIEVAKEKGLDLSGHQSRRIMLEDVVEAERIFVMSEDQKRLLSSAVPGSEEKIAVMQVPDPYGGDLSVYRACFEQMKKWFLGYLKEHPLCAE